MTRRFDTFALIFVQVVTIGVGSVVIAAFEGFGYGDRCGGASRVLVTGVGCSAIAFSLSAWAQRIIDPERAGVINLLEPVVAGVIGYFVGERLGVSGYLGAALILGRRSRRRSAGTAPTAPRDGGRPAVTPTRARRDPRHP